MDQQERDLRTYGRYRNSDHGGKQQLYGGRRGNRILRGVYFRRLYERGIQFYHLFFEGGKFSARWAHAQCGRNDHGIARKAGTYTFTVVLTAKNEESGTNPAATPFAEGGDKGDGGKGDGGKGDGGNKDKTAETTFVIVVKGETTGGDTDITIEDLNDKISDLESTIKDLQNSLEGNTSSGCGSSVTGGAALVGAVVLLGATICMVVSRKKKN